MNPTPLQVYMKWLFSEPPVNPVTGAVYLDLDGLLDRCSCGAVVGFSYAGEKVAAACAECAKCTDFLDDSSAAMVAWNKLKRGIT